MDELLTKLKPKYPGLTLSRVHLSRIVRDINITLKQTRLRHAPKTNKEGVRGNLGSLR